jgi:hypothetical protein
MSIENTIPENKNFLSPMKFRFFIKKSPTVNFFVQRANVPGIVLPPTTHENPFVKIPYQGDHVQYEDLVITFKVDEDLNNYMEIHNWIRGMGFPTDFSEYAALASKSITSGEGLRSDISLMLLSSKDNPIFDVVFIDAFPYSLSGMELSSIDEQTTISATAIFKYTHYDINPMT